MFSTRPLDEYSPQLLSELETAELFVLSSLRLWFLSHCDRERRYPDWRGAFQAAGISKSGTLGFDHLCRIVGTTTLRSLDIHWLQCGRVGDYEACMLKTIGLLQRNLIESAESTLLEWCPVAAVRVALEPASALAEALCERSLVIAMRRTHAGPRAQRAKPTVAIVSESVH